MSATTAPIASTRVDLGTPESRRGSLFGDVWVIARRGLWHMRRHPETLADATFQPVMFVLLFAYVFGGAISVPGGGDYKEFLMGGIFAQSIVFGSSFGVAMTISSDRSNGAVDRFRSLPMAAGSLLAGHAVANLLKAFLPMLLMSICGYIIGWRIRDGFVEAAAGYGLLLVFAFAMIWVGVLLGSLLSTPEAVQGVAFVALFPITFLASTFVPAGTLPGALRTFAEWNPVSTLADSLRQLFGNPHATAGADAPWPSQHPIAYTLLACALIVVVAAPIAISRFQSSISD